LKEGNDVMLVGHSYGGAVVSMVAEKLNTFPKRDTGKLQIVTFGSIYVANTEAVSNMHMRQFMFTNDIVLKINKLKHDSMDVTWLHSGKKGEFSSHNSYSIYSVISNKDVNEYPVLSNFECDDLFRAV
jgi:hypothetical protein